MVEIAGKPGSAGPAEFRTRRTAGAGAEAADTAAEAETATETGATSSPEPPPDLDSFRAPPLDPPESALGVVELGGDAADADPAAPEPEKIDREAFWEVFRIGFAFPGMIRADLKPLAVQDDEHDAARPASDAIYRLLELWYPAALSPSSETLACVMQAAPFLTAKAVLVRDILAARRARPVQGGDAPRGSAPGEDGAPAEAQGADPLAWVAS